MSAALLGASIIPDVRRRSSEKPGNIKVPQRNKPSYPRTVEMRPFAVRFKITYALILLAISCLPAQAEPDQLVLGKGLGYPVGTSSGSWYRNPFRVGSWSAMDQVEGLRVRTVARGSGAVMPLP